jgi:ectoine hydroxylase-related dioxygenase (phytanoyl-CoA dioxygenase family)
MEAILVTEESALSQTPPVEKRVTDFARNGYLLVENFYDYESEIAPILGNIRRIIEIVARKYDVPAAVSTPEEAMTKGYQSVIAVNRKYGGEIYDAVKQIPALVRLISAEKNSELFSQMRLNSIPAIAAGGYGIRIDNPNEEKFRAPWHQDFPGHLRSIDGIVFWSPLLEVTRETGPVEICEGSHKDGPVPVYEDDGGIGKFGAYALRLDQEAERLKKYRHVAPLTRPGDLLLLDYLTLHGSGLNVSDRPRWTMQWRMFNFADPVGIRIGWSGSLVVGQDFRTLLPELVAPRPAAGARL